MYVNFIHERQTPKFYSEWHIFEQFFMGTLLLGYCFYQKAAKRKKYFSKYLDLNYKLWSNISNYYHLLNCDDFMECIYRHCHKIADSRKNPHYGELTLRFLQIQRNTIVILKNDYFRHLLFKVPKAFSTPKKMSTNTVLFRLELSMEIVIQSFFIRFYSKWTF